MKFNTIAVICLFCIALLVEVASGNLKTACEYVKSKVNPKDRSISHYVEKNAYTEDDCELKCNLVQECRAFVFQRRGKNEKTPTCTFYKLKKGQDLPDKVRIGIIVHRKTTCQRCKYENYHYKTIDVLAHEPNKNLVQIVDRVKNNFQCEAACNKLSSCYGFTYDSSNKLCELLSNSGRVHKAASGSKPCKCSKFYRKLACEIPDTRPKVAVDYISSCNGRCLNSNDPKKCPMSTSFFTLYDKNPSTCLDTRSMGSMHCFRLILYPKVNRLKTLIIQLGQCNPNTDLIMIRDKKHLSSPSLCRVSGSCKYICNTGHVKQPQSNLYLEVIDSHNADFLPSRRSKFCQLDVTLDGKNGRLIPTGNFVAGKNCRKH